MPLSARLAEHNGNHLRLRFSDKRRQEVLLRVGDVVRCVDSHTWSVKTSHNVFYHACIRCS
jgi:hypothetical protein